MALYDREWQQQNPDKLKELLNRPNPIGSVNQFADPAYAQKQQALYQRFQTTTNPAERNYLLANLHGGMLDEKQNIEKFKAANPTLNEPVLGSINQDVQWQDASSGNGIDIMKRFQRGNREYVPGLGIVQTNFMGPTFGVEKVGAHQSGGLFGTLRRNDEELRRAGGTIMGGALGLFTGNPVLAALMAARGGYTGQAPTGTEVLGTALTMGARGLLAPAKQVPGQTLVGTGNSFVKEQMKNLIRQQLQRIPKYIAEKQAKQQQEKIRAQMAMLQQRRQAQGV